MFQSTRPVRGATCIITSKGCDCFVSIHAPRAGRDTSRWQSASTRTSFNPRAPCGARRICD